LYRETAHIIVDANTTQRSKFMQKLLTAIESCRQGA
jgi:hypothetical protein